MREKLKKARLSKNMTQNQIAKKVNISRAHYTNIELGNKDPSFKVARDIKKVLDRQDDEIFLIINVTKGNKISA